MKFDAPTVGSASGRWFPASTALEVIRAIRTHLLDAPDDVEDAGTVLTQLGTLEHILEAAEEHGVRFRLGLDY